MASVGKREWLHHGETRVAWVVRYTDQGGKRRLKTCESKKAADKERLRIEKEIEDHGHTPDSETLSFREAAAAWLKDCERRHHIGDKMSTTTFKSYERNLRDKVNPKIGNVLISRLDGRHVQDMIDELSRTYKPNTLKYPYIVVQQVLQFARRKKWTKRDPLTEDPVRLPRTVTRVPIPSIADLENLLAASEQRGPAERELTRLQKSAVVALGIFAGLRRGEMAGLQWQFVDFARGEIRVRHSLSVYDGLKGPKSAAGNRNVPMSSIVRQRLGALHRHMDRPAEGFVFVGRDGRYVDAIGLYSDRYMKAMKLADLVGDDGRPRFTLHALRHAAASLLIAEGLSPMHIMRVMGHAEIGTTMNIYGHLFPEDVAARNSIDAIGSRFGATAERHATLSL